MYNKIKSIFKNKIIENIQDTKDTSYYYFYQDHTCTTLFGIKKDISSSEYLMLNTMFVEKKTYSLDQNQQKIGEYLFARGANPFKKDTKFIVYSVNDEDESIVNKVLSDIYQNIIVIKYLKYNIVFGLFDKSINEMFQAFTTDFGYNIPCHLGFTIHKETKGQDIIEYINYYSKNIYSNEFTNIKDIIIYANNKNIDIINIIKENTIKKITDQHSTIELISVLLKNNLNVSLTSKLLYMHRNSVLNKLEQIEKITDLNIQNFNDAYAMKVLLDL